MLPIRSTDYASGLRLPVDDTAHLDGVNQFTGSNYFDSLNVRLLYVTQYAEFRGPLTAISATSAAVFGTVDPQDARFLSNNIVRFQLAQGGGIFIASAIASAAYWSDNFNRADENPAVGWTSQLPTSAIVRVSANVLYASAVSAFNSNQRIPFWFNNAQWGTDQDSSAQLSAIATDASVFWGVAARIASAANVLTFYYYYADANSPHTMQLGLVSAGTITILSSQTGQTLANGDVIRLLCSGTSCIATRNGTLSLSATDSTITAGLPGVMWRFAAAAPAVALDNWQSSGLASPLSAEDVAFQVSAILYTWDGAGTYNRWANLLGTNVQLGDQSNITIMGAVSAVVSAGASAFLPATTYGVTRLISSIGTAGLSGVVALSAGTGLQISAVGQTIWELPQSVIGVSCAGTGASGLSGVIQLSAGGVVKFVSAIGQLILISG